MGGREGGISTAEYSLQSPCPENAKNQEFLNKLQVYIRVRISRLSSVCVGGTSLRAGWPDIRTSPLMAPPRGRKKWRLSTNQLIAPYHVMNVVSLVVSVGSLSWHIFDYPFPEILQSCEFIFSLFNEEEVLFNGPVDV